MPYKAIIDAQGRIPLRTYEGIGYAPGTVVEIIPTRAGSLIIAIDSAPLVLVDAPQRRFRVTRAQLALVGKGTT